MKYALCLSLLWPSLLLFSATAGAQGRPEGPPPGPPPEAIAACTGKAVGTTVSFAGRNGETVSGVCEQVGNVVAARPAGGRPGGAPR